MWGNQWKITFFNAIKSEETAKINKEFMKMDKLFIRRKFKEKITPQDPEKKKKIQSQL